MKYATHARDMGSDIEHDAVTALMVGTAGIKAT